MARGGLGRGAGDPRRRRVREDRHSQVAELPDPSGARHRAAGGAPIARLRRPSRMEQRLDWHARRARLSETLHYHFVTLDADGRFRISGVPAGDYDFAIALYQPPEGGCLVSPVGTKVVRVRVTDEAARRRTLDLGDITVPVKGRPAPRRGGPRPRLHRLLRRDREPERPEGTICPPRILGDLVRPVRRGAAVRSVASGSLADDFGFPCVRACLKSHPRQAFPGIGQGSRHLLGVCLDSRG